MCQNRTVPEKLQVAYNMLREDVDKVLADIATALGITVEELERRLEDESNHIASVD